MNLVLQLPPPPRRVTRAILEAQTGQCFEVSTNGNECGHVAFVQLDTNQVEALQRILMAHLVWNGGDGPFGTVEECETNEVAHDAGGRGQGVSTQLGVVNGQIEYRVSGRRCVGPSGLGQERSRRWRRR